MERAGADRLRLAMKKKSSSSVQLVTWGVKLVDGLVLKPGLVVASGYLFG